MVYTTSIAVNGVKQRLLAGDPSRVAIAFFSPDIGGFFVGPLESLSDNGALIRVNLQAMRIVKLSHFGELLGWEWWYNGTGIGTVNCIEVVN